MTIVPAARRQQREHGAGDGNRGDRTRTCNPRFWRPVLYQLSYAPWRFEGFSVSAPSSAILRGVTDQDIDQQTHPEEDDLLEEQEHKGYGDDEGERDESLPDDS
jgi:hypothetical protein